MTPRADMPFPSDHSFRRAEQQAAADWVARRDRGLTASEQDDYLQWLHDDSRRAAAVAKHEATVRRLQQLAQWQPACSSEPNPDLFARPRRRAWWRTAAAVSTLAAAGLVGMWVLRRPSALPPAATESAKSFLLVNERQVLSDGSVVELRDGSRLEVAFTDGERRVRLSGGEAHFTVTSNAARPFVVEAGNVAVRAVGTAFVVRLDAALVDVMVTEGKVQIEQPSTAGSIGAPAAEGAVVSAHERATVSLAATAPALPQVSPVTAEEMDDALAWKAPRFQFYETPLAEAVAEFNRHNAQQIQIADAALGRERIGGTFRVDNVDGFVSLLELTLGVAADRAPGGPVMLRHSR